MELHGSATSDQNETPICEEPVQREHPIPVPIRHAGLTSHRHGYTERTRHLGVRGSDSGARRP